MMAGAVNAWLWRGLVRSVVGGHVRLRWFPSVPTAFLLGVVSLVYLTRFASTEASVGGGHSDRSGAVARAQDNTPDKTLLLVTGYGSQYR